MSDEQTPECTPNAHHELREQYAHLAVGHHPDCSCVLCGLRKMAGYIYQQPPREYRGRWPGSDELREIVDIDEFPIFEHVDPVWRGLADHLIMFREDDYNGTVFEQLWARKVAPSAFQVCCIPQVAYGVALGDTVEADDSFLIRGVVDRSGHTTFRIQSEDGWYEKIDVLNRIAGLGGLMEIAGYYFTAIDVEGGDTWDLWEYLQQGEAQGLFAWEQGHWGAGPERPR